MTQEVLHRHPFPLRVHGHVQTGLCGSICKAHVPLRHPLLDQTRPKGSRHRLGVGADVPAVLWGHRFLVPDTPDATGIGLHQTRTIIDGRSQSGC